jgi:hypothetical protein
MGGRGSAGGATVGKYASSRDYKSAYQDTVNTQTATSWFLDKGVSARDIADNMYMYRQTMGESMLESVKRDISAARSELKEADTALRYGASKATVEGIKAGLRENIRRFEAVQSKMNSQEVRDEYEKRRRQSERGNAASRRRGGRWM